MAHEHHKDNHQGHAHPHGNGHEHGHDHDDHHGHGHDHGHKHGHDHKHDDKHNHKHDHGHGHSAGHGHHHHGAGGHHHHGDPTTQRKAFVIAIVLNLGFVAVEFIYGLIANSTALLADAGHNLSDVLGLVLALAATILARRAPSSRFTYGLRSSSILAALANAMFLLIACGGVAWEAVQRFSAPPPIAGLTVTLVAAAGIVVNGASAWLFVRGSKDDLNVRAAYMHMVADAAVSLGVVITGLVMMGTGWYWLDPVASIAIVIVIVIGTWGLLRESTQLALSAVPSHVDLAAVEAYLLALPGVSAIHDLHIWGMSTTETAMTVHLVVPAGYPGDVFIDEAVAGMKSRFAIQHCTIQFEQGTTDHVCGLHAPQAPRHHAGHAHAH